MIDTYPLIHVTINKFSFFLLFHYLGKSDVMCILLHNNLVDSWLKFRPKKKKRINTKKEKNGRMCHRITYLYLSTFLRPMPYSVRRTV